MTGIWAPVRQSNRKSELQLIFVYVEDGAFHTGECDHMRKWSRRAYHINHLGKDRTLYD